MGMAACNVVDRLAASVGDIAVVAPVFQAVADVPNGGVLFALPAVTVQPPTEVRQFRQRKQPGLRRGGQRRSGQALRRCRMTSAR